MSHIDTGSHLSRTILSIPIVPVLIINNTYSLSKGTGWTIIYTVTPLTEQSETSSQRENSILYHLTVIKHNYFMHYISITSLTLRFIKFHFQRYNSKIYVSVSF